MADATRFKAHPGDRIHIRLRIFLNFSHLLSDDNRCSAHASHPYSFSPKDNTVCRAYNPNDTLHTFSHYQSNGRPGGTRYSSPFFYNNSYVPHGQILTMLSACLYGMCNMLCTCHRAYSYGDNHHIQRRPSTRFSGVLHERIPHTFRFYCRLFASTASPVRVSPWPNRCTHNSLRQK